MDSNQSATNKRDFDVASLQNQDADNVSNSSDEDGGSAKRFKKEQLDPLKTASVNFMQNQDDENVPMEMDDASIEISQAELDPLQIGSILGKVFSNLDVNSIKNARQVNPLWSIEGAKMLMLKCYLKIPRYLRKKPRNSKSINEFKAFLSHKSSDRSMIPSISIYKKGDVKLWKSLEVLGQQVESLKLNIIDDEAEMLKNLLDLLPNLKYLRIKNPDSWHRAEIWLNIIKVLTSVMSSTEKDQRPLVISNIDFGAYLLEQLENFEQFADCNNILIEALTCFIVPWGLGGVPNLSIRISQFMNKLLSKSRNTFKSLIIVGRALVLPLLEFPIMPALTNLVLDPFIQHVDPLQPLKFSPTFRFSEKVPNLIQINLSLYDFLDVADSQFFVHLFEQTGTAPSVKILQYHYESVNLDIDPLLLTFPNIEKYNTSGYTYSQKMFESIWTFGTNLKKLTITIKNLRSNPADIAVLDSSITGFTRETVDKIKETPNLAPYPLEEMEQLRVNPSILNLKHLEHLTIHFKEFNQDDIPGRFLATAGEYAFKLMPKESKIFLNFHIGELGREGPRSPLLNEVSKLANVTVTFSPTD